MKMEAETIWELMEVQMAIGKKILFVILLYINQLTAISIKDIKQNYMYGLGQATNLQQADKRAINDLISQISVQVDSSFTNIMVIACYPT